MSFYSTDYSAQRRNRLSQFQQALQRIMAARQAANNNYAAGSSALQIEKPNILRGVLNNFAGRGMAYSSGYGQEVQNTETDFASRLASMAADRNAALSQADLDESEETNNFNYDLSDLQGQQAAYEAERQQALVASRAQAAQTHANIQLTRAKAKQAAQPRPQARPQHTATPMKPKRVVRKR